MIFILLFFLVFLWLVSKEMPRGEFVVYVFGFVGLVLLIIAITAFSAFVAI